MKDFKYRLFAALTIFGLDAFGWAFAQQGRIRVDDFRNTNGANGRKVDDMLTGGTNTMQRILDFVFVVCTVIGVILVAGSMYKLYEASKEEREKPKSAIVGLFVGGGLTAVGLITGYIANTMGI